MEKVLSLTEKAPQISASVEALSVYRTYKDRVFRLLFSDRKRLLELYNALNDTEYTDENDLTVNTLENAIFMKMKNDLSFMIGSAISLYEHQSSWCPNMALRGFLYFADLYKKLLGNTDLSVRRRILITTPHYIVFYNGIEAIGEECVQRLSESFEEEYLPHKASSDWREGCIELTVRIININYGQNMELMRKCRSLSDYARFVAEIRKNLETMSMEDAVRNAVEECIAGNILKDFLTQQKAEVTAMSIYEYNEEYVKKVLYEDGYKEGRAVGEVAGIISSIRQMHSRGYTPEDIADLLDQKKESVDQILRLTGENPDMDSTAVAKLVLNQGADPCRSVGFSGLASESEAFKYSY